MQQFRQWYIKLSQAWAQWHEGTASNLIDPMLTSKSGPVHEMMRCIHIGLLCVQENVVDRPTMATIAIMLSSASTSLPLPSGPSFFMHSDISPEVSLLQEHNSRMSESLNEPSITDLYPRWWNHIMNFLIWCLLFLFSLVNYILPWSCSFALKFIDDSIHLYKTSSGSSRVIFCSKTMNLDIIAYLVSLKIILI